MGGEVVTVSDFQVPIPSPKLENPNPLVLTSVDTLVSHSLWDCG